MKYEHTLRTEPIYTLVEYFKNLKRFDEYQLFDVSIHNGALYCRTRITNDDGDFFTHYETFIIDRDGISHAVRQTPIDD
jgi:hypothetical protein